MVEVDLMHILISDEGFKDFSDLEILWECLTFLLAGASTVANTMANLLYYTAKKSEITDKIRTEIYNVCLKDLPPPKSLFDGLNHDSSQELTYMMQCFKESQRFEPAVPASLI